MCKYKHNWCAYQYTLRDYIIILKMFNVELLISFLNLDYIVYYCRKVYVWREGHI